MHHPVYIRTYIVLANVHFIFLLNCIGVGTSFCILKMSVCSILVRSIIHKNVWFLKIKFPCTY